MNGQSKRLAGGLTNFSSKFIDIIRLKRHIPVIALSLLIALGAGLAIYGLNLYYIVNKRLVTKTQGIYIEVGENGLSFDEIGLVIRFDTEHLPSIGLTLRFSVNFAENFWFRLSVPHRAISHTPNVTFVYNEETDTSSFEAHFNLSGQSYFEELYAFETEIRNLISYNQYQFTLPFVIDGAKYVKTYKVIAICQEIEAFVVQSLHPTTPQYFSSAVIWNIADLEAEKFSTVIGEEHFTLILPTISAIVENGQKTSERDFMNFQSGLFTGIGISLMTGTLTDIIKSALNRFLRIKQQNGKTKFASFTFRNIFLNWLNLAH